MAGFPRPWVDARLSGASRGGDVPHLAAPGTRASGVAARRRTTSVSRPPVARTDGPAAQHV